jgi:hypothetical protein
MTKEEIIELARQAWISNKEAQLITEFDEAYISCTYVTDLKAFAELVAKKTYLDGLENGIKAEREACLKIAESKRHAPNFQLTSMPPQNGTAVDIANLIRERGKA